MMIAIISLMVSSCKVTQYDFHKVLQDDEKMLTAEYGEVTFWEAQVKYDRPITEKGAKIIYVYTAWGIKDGSVTVKHAENHFEWAPEVQYSIYPWYGDYSETINTTIKADKALRILKSSISDVPESKLMVLRRPLIKDSPEHKLYIFGDNHHGVFGVDCENGDIVELSFSESGLEKPSSEVSE